MRLRLMLPLALTVAACAAPRSEPTPAASGLPPAGDDAALLRDIEALAHDSMEGRRVGTPGGARARRYLLAAFTQVGIRPFGTGYEAPFAMPGRSAGDTVRGVNVVGWLPGSGADVQRYIVVTAHYDHLGIRNDAIYNGADDNASGTAALLAIARELRARPLRHPVILVALDGEESGLAGARAFVATPPVAKGALALNVNMDMVSHSASGELWAAGAHHTPWLRPVLDEVARLAPVTLKQGHDRPEQGPNDWTTQSDHGAFHRAGIPFIYFGVEDHPDYHKPTDDVATITPDFYARAVRTILASLRAIDGALAMR